MKSTPPDAQNSFYEALLDPDMPVPQNVVDPDGRIAPKRFAVYRNNVTVSLIEALRATFVSVEALVGVGFFRQMARRFVRAHPPKSPLLMEYGVEFAAFVADHKPAAQMPFLPDVARLDRAWLDAYHAADAPTLGADALNVETLGAQTLVPHPAFRLIPSRYPLADLWHAARAGDLSQMPDVPRPQWALVTRPDLAVKVHGLDPIEGEFFRRLAVGRPLAEASELALAEDENFDLTQALGHLVAWGAFAAP